MTCIVGLVENGKVYIGGDSLITQKSYSQSIKKQKVFIKDNILFGCSGIAKSVQHFRFKFKIPDQKSTENDLKYLCFTFIEELSKSFCGAGINPDDYPCILVGFNGHLYKIGEDLVVTESCDNFNSCGCGSTLAVAAMKALNDHTKLTPKLKIQETLKVAAHFNKSVQKPFDILSI
jgi:ATP-dependent protease HslVU (ClpYQ) peptidase subunit